MSRDRGYSVSIVATRPDREAAPEFPSTYLPIVEDYSPARFRKYIEAAKWYSVQYDPPAYRAFRRTLEKNAAEIIHFHNCQFLTLSLLSAAKRAGRKTVVSIYDYWLFCPTVMLVDPEKKFCAKAHGPWCVDCLPPMFRAFQKLLLSVRRRVIDHYLEMVNAFHVLSEHSATVLEGYGIDRDKIHVVPLTLPIEYRTIQAIDDDPSVEPDMILFAGWLNERKGLHRLLQAMPLVVEKHPRAHLTVIGGSVKFGEEYEKRLDEIIQARELGDRVTFTGHVQPAEMKKYIQRAAVVVIPEQFENMSPLLMIEAMSMAKPVVISRSGGIPEFIEDGVSGWLADPLDPRDFAEKILDVLVDPERAKAVGQRAGETILTKCDEERVWTKTRRMYESLMN